MKCSFAMLNICIFLHLFVLLAKSDSLYFKNVAGVESDIPEINYGEKKIRSNSNSLLSSLRDGCSLLMQRNGKQPLISTENSTLILKDVSVESKGYNLLDAFKNSKTFVTNVKILGNGEFYESLISTDSKLVLDAVSFHFNTLEGRAMYSIVKSSGNADISIENFEMSNVVNKESSTILFEGGIEKLSLESSKFFNISWGTGKKLIKNGDRVTTGSGFASLEVKDSYVEKSESPYYGSICSINNFHRSFVYNSTFMHCVNTDETGMEAGTEHKDYNANENIFESVTFEGIGHAGNGGALYFNGTASAYINNCVFHDCNNTNLLPDDESTIARGGAIWYKATGTFICIASNFSDCHAEEGDGYMSVWCGTEIELNWCNFANTTAHRFGGVTIELAKNNTCLFRCDFKNANSVEYGGGGGLMPNYIPDNFTISECSFFNLTSGWQAGALMFLFQNDTTHVKLRFLKFENCTSGKNQGGDIYFHSGYNGHTEWYTKDNLYMCVTNNLEHSVGLCMSEQNDRTCVYGNKSSAYVDLDDYTREYPSSELNVDDSGRDEYGCGSNREISKPRKVDSGNIKINAEGDTTEGSDGETEVESRTYCKTLNFSITEFHPLFNKEIYILPGGSPANEVVNVGYFPIPVIGKGNNGRPMVAVKGLDADNTTLIRISSGNLTLTDVNLYMYDGTDKLGEYVLCSLNDPTALLGFTNCEVILKGINDGSVVANRKKSLIEINNGTLKLENAVIGDIVTDNAALISLIFKDCYPKVVAVGSTIKNIVRNVGNGSVFETVILSEKTLTLDGLTFDNCKCNSGIGGAVYLNVEEKGGLYVGKETETVVKNNKYDDNESRRGAAFYIEAHGKSIVQFNKVSFSNNNAFYGNNLFLYVNGGSLKDFVTSGSNNFSVAEEKHVDFDDYVGESKDIDGAPEPLIFLVARIDSIFINEGHTDYKYAKHCGYKDYQCNTIDYALESTLGFADLTLSGTVHLSKRFNCTDRGYTIRGIEGGADTVFDISGNAYFDVLKASSFINVPFAIASDLKKDDNNVVDGLFLVSDESLSMSDCSLNVGSANSLTYSVWNVKGGKVELNSVSFNNENKPISLSSSLFVISNGDATLNGFDVKNIALGGENEKNGSAINAIVKEGCSLELKGCHFTDCSVSNGNGGALFIELVGNGKFSIDNGTKYEKSESSVKSNEDQSSFTRCIASKNGGPFYLYLKDNAQSYNFGNIQFEGNNAEVGVYVFVYCQDLSTQTRRDMYNFYYKDDHYSNDLMGIDEVEYAKAVNLLDVWVDLLPEVFVKRDGEDSIDCGPIEKECKSLNYGLWHMETNGSIKVSKGTEVNRKIIVGSLTVISNDTSKYTVDVAYGGQDGEGVFEGTEAISFSNAVFVCKSAVHFSSIFVEKYGVLNIANCGIQLSSSVNERVESNQDASERELTFSFANVEDGELVLDGMELTGYKLKVGIVSFTDKTKNIKLSNLKINEVECEKGIFEFRTTETEEVGEVVFAMENCNYNNIVKSDETAGTVFAMDSSSSSVTLSWTNCNFINCQSTNAAINGNMLDIFSTTATFTGCTFAGPVKEEQTEPTESSQRAESNEGENVCLWTHSLVRVSGGKATFVESKIVNSTEGGLEVVGGSEVTLNKCELSGNVPEENTYNIQRNILCTGSTLTITEPVNNPSDLWISSSECNVESLASYVSILYIPTISNGSYTGVKNDARNLTVEGTNLIPCELRINFAVYNGDEELSKSEYEVTEFNEEGIIGSVPNSLFAVENCTYYISLTFPDGRGGRVETSAVAITESKGGNPSQSTNILSKWWFWLIIAIAALILLLIIVCICCCCCRGKKDEEKEQEMAEEERVDNGMAENALFAKDDGGQTMYNPYGDTHDAKVITGQAGLGRLLDAYSCNEPYEKVSVDMAQAFTFQMNSPTSVFGRFGVTDPNQREVVSIRLCLQLVNGLIHFMGGSLGKRIALYLSPQTIVIGEGGYVYVVCLRKASQQELSGLREAESARLNQIQQNNRWTAPEILKKDASSSNQNAGFEKSQEAENLVGEKSVVFTVGTILYQMFALSEPFAESDIVTAGAKISKGDRPNLNTMRIDHKRLCDVIRRCWAQNEAERPTLGQLKNRLTELASGNNGNGDDDSDEEW